MAKFTIEDFKNNDEYKKIVKRILVSVLIIIPYIVLFFFLEKYDVVDRGRFALPTEAAGKNLIRENELLRQENLRLTEELERLKSERASEETAP